MIRDPRFESVGKHQDAGFAYFRRHASSFDLHLMLLAFGSLALFSAVVATVFALAGAWLIIPFAGLEIVALAAAVVMILRRAGDFERLEVRGDHVLFEVRERGEARRFEFHRSWARVVQGEAGMIALRSHGREVAIGRFCGAESRLALARELNSRLGG